MIFSTEWKCEKCNYVSIHTSFDNTTRCHYQMVEWSELCYLRCRPAGLIGRSVAIKAKGSGFKSTSRHTFTVRKITTYINDYLRISKCVEWKQKMALEVLSVFYTVAPKIEYAQVLLNMHILLYRYKGQS